MVGQEKQSSRDYYPRLNQISCDHGEYAGFIYGYIFFEDASHDPTLPITTKLL